MQTSRGDDKTLLKKWFGLRTASVIQMWSCAFSCRKILSTSSPSGSWSNCSSITWKQKYNLSYWSIIFWGNQVNSTSSSVSLSGISIEVAILEGERYIIWPCNIHKMSRFWCSYQALSENSAQNGHIDIVSNGPWRRKNTTTAPINISFKLNETFRPRYNSDMQFSDCSEWGHHLIVVGQFACLNCP